MMTVRSLHSRTPMTTARNDAVPTLKLSSLSSVALAQAAAYPTVYLLSVAPIGRHTLKGVGSIFPDHRDLVVAKPRVATQ